MDIKFTEEEIQRLKAAQCANPIGLLDENTRLRQQLTDLTACLEWADKNVVPFRGVSRFGWLAWVKDTGYHGPTLFQALTTAYENRDKTI